MNEPPKQCKSCSNLDLCVAMNCTKEKECKSYFPKNEDWKDSVAELRKGDVLR